MSACKLIPAAEFKQKCLALMDEVALLGTELVITKRGAPVCKLSPLSTASKPRFGWLKGSVTLLGDLTEPIGEKWEVNK